MTRAQYHLLWPNLTINVDPGPPNLSFDTWIPVGPHEVAGVSDYFFGEDVTDEEAREIMAFGSQVAAEDMALVESVQRGLDSGLVPHGRLLPSSEHLIQHFQRLVYESLGERVREAQSKVGVWSAIANRPDGAPPG